MNIEKLINDWRNSVDDYAKAKAEAEYLKEFRKSKKALLMVEAEQKGLKTGQERESYAYSHQEYTELLEGLKQAIEQSESLRWRMTIAEKRVAVWQTENANNRKEMKHYGA
jgi:hypothetical protein